MNSAVVESLGGVSMCSFFANRIDDGEIDMSICSNACEYTPKNLCSPFHKERNWE